MEQSSQVITSSISSSILPSSLPESSQYSVYLFATADSLLLSVSIVFAKSLFVKSGLSWNNQGSTGPDRKVRADLPFGPWIPWYNTNRSLTVLDIGPSYWLSLFHKITHTFYLPILSYNGIKSASHHLCITDQLFFWLLSNVQPTINQTFLRGLNTNGSTYSVYLPSFTSFINDHWTSCQFPNSKGPFKNEFSKNLFTKIKD